MADGTGKVSSGIERYSNQGYQGIVCMSEEGKAFMSNYASEEQMILAGQSCKFFKSVRSGGKKFVDYTEGVSCRICDNWNGSKCIVDSFNSVLTGLGQD